MPAVVRGWSAALGGLGASGVVLILLAWAQTRDTVAVDDQMSWAAVGLAGATMMGLAALGALSLVRRAVRERLGLVGSMLAGHLASVGGPAVPEIALPAETRLAAPNMRHYHRPECAMVTGKPGRAAFAAEHGQAGLRPCGVCEA